jgi:hypothetical protein
MSKLSGPVGTSRLQQRLDDYRLTGSLHPRANAINCRPRQATAAVPAWRQIALVGEMNPKTSSGAAPLNAE